MKISIKILAVLLLVVTLFACEKEKTDISLERDGTLYEVADQVSFYYPKDFQLNVNNENQKDVRFTKNDEMYIYSTIIDDTDNVCLLYTSDAADDSLV